MPLTLWRNQLWRHCNISSMGHISPNWWLSYKSYIKSNPNMYGNRFDAYEEVLNSSGNQSETQIMDRLRNINLIRDNFLQLKFVLNSRIPFVLVDQPLMNASLMISSIGDSLSLWLGITVITFAEVIEFIYTLLGLLLQKTNHFESSWRLNRVFKSHL